MTENTPMLLPGPWVVDASTNHNVVGVADASGNPICEIWHGVEGWTLPSACTTKEWKLDHARLIAAAPELLEACLAARALTPDGTHTAGVLDAAIARATGAA